MLLWKHLILIISTGCLAYSSGDLIAWPWHHLGFSECPVSCITWLVVSSWIQVQEGHLTGGTGSQQEWEDLCAHLIEPGSNKGVGKCIPASEAPALKWPCHLQPDPSSYRVHNSHYGHCKDQASITQSSGGKMTSTLAPFMCLVCVGEYRRPSEVTLLLMFVSLKDGNVAKNGTRAVKTKSLQVGNSPWGPTPWERFPRRSWDHLLMWKMRNGDEIEMNTNIFFYSIV